VYTQANTHGEVAKIILYFSKLLEMFVEFAGTGKPSKDNIWKPAGRKI